MSEEVPRDLRRSVAKTMIDMVEDSDEPKVYVGAAGKAPYSLGSGLLSDDDEDIEEEEQPDEEILEHNKEYKAEYAKRLRCDEEYCDGFEAHTPDLASYFQQFGLPNFSVIAICRTYANYLAQQERTKLPNLSKVKKIKVKK